MHQQFARLSARNKGDNTIVTGYPGTDVFLKNQISEAICWKPTNQPRKRIIWAPHHTIEEKGGEIEYSNFLNYHDFFLELTKTHPVQIAFKPHPILKVKLYNHPDWGEKKTEEYFLRWERSEFMQLCDGAYYALFKQSDALIHDSGSFLVEYLYCEKPSLFCLRSEAVREQFNDFGKLALSVHYLALDTTQIVDFIQDVVIGGNDIKAEERKDFYENYLIPPHGHTASYNIFESIKRAIA